LKEVFKTLSIEVPALVKKLIASIFSEEAGRDMGKAAGAFYKELINSGIPPDVAVRMTEKYIGVFTNLGELLKGMGKRKKKENELEKEIERRIREKLEED
jgi:hypothetical protein